jgi:hypothetical protein
MGTPSVPTRLPADSKVDWPHFGLFKLPQCRQQRPTSKFSFCGAASFARNLGAIGIFSASKKGESDEVLKREKFEMTRCDCIIATDV